MIDEVMVQRESAAVMQTYARQPVAFARGEGASLFDPTGRRYVDCMAGISMNNVGHCHPAVVTAIADQAARLINVSNLYYTEPMVALAEWIRDHSLGGRVYFVADDRGTSNLMFVTKGGDLRPLTNGTHMLTAPSKYRCVNESVRWTRFPQVAASSSLLRRISSSTEKSESEFSGALTVK